MRSSNFSLDDRHSHREKSDPKPLDSSSRNEACQIRCKSLNKGHCEVYEATDPDTPLPSHDIPEITGKECTDSRRELKARNSNTWYAIRKLVLDRTYAFAHRLETG